MQVFIDLETIPGQSAWIRDLINDDIEEKIGRLRPPGNYKKQESIDKWLNDEAVKLRSEFGDSYQRCGLDAGTGEIVSACFAIDDNEPQVFARGPQDGEPTELDILAEFFDELRIELGPSGSAGVEWVGHNHIDFDLPYLYKRCVALSYRPPIHFPHSGRMRDVYDTMKEWAGWGKRISQDKLCRILGIPGKDGMTGADVYPTWLNGDIDVIADYNVRDVETVRKIYKRMTFKG